MFEANKLGSKMKTFTFTTSFVAPRNKFIKAMQKTDLVIWIVHARKNFRIDVEYRTADELKLAQDIALATGMSF